MSKKHNFGAGPCILPQEVFEEASKAVLNFNGLSILEISHRSPEFVAVMSEAQDLVKEMLHVPDGYSVIFLQGGASLGFLITAMNMSGTQKKAAYVNTGVWSNKAIKEGKVSDSLIKKLEENMKEVIYIKVNMSGDYQAVLMLLENYLLINH